ncbi:SulP family inorganic anion transporter [Nannocystis pusilla]|uniref:SulP family inorganic anion transporter n=1 Tax=Nannocystis pusilla TaxID=889268 RepID=UPI003BF0ED60
MPLLVWLPRYRRSDLPGDLTAGLTTAVMLIPQAMAYAMLAGLPPIVGLYAAIAPLVVYALFGGSAKLAVGPVAMDSLLVAAALSGVTLAAGESQVTVAAALAVMVGAVQLTMGALGLGFVVNFLSQPVLAAFTSAAAVVIAASQLGALFGVKLPASTGIHAIAADLWAARAGLHAPTLLVGLAAMALLLALRRFRGRALMVVVLALAGSWALDLPAHGVAVLGPVPAGLPTPALPVASWATIVALAPAAVTIALLSFVEALSSSLAVADAGDRPAPDRELAALGLSNIATGFMRGYPIAGGLSRTAVNAQAGARTGLAGVFTAGLVALALVVLAPLLRDLPRAALAAIILVSVAGLVDLELPRALWRLRRRESMTFGVTLAATLMLGITLGLALGVLLSLALFVLRTTRPHTAELGRLPGTEVYRNRARFADALPVPGLLLLRLDAQLYFANAAFLREAVLRRLESAKAPIRAVILDCSGIHDVDVSALATLRELRRTLTARGVELHFAAVTGPVRDVFARSSFAAEVGAQRFSFTVHEAVRRALGEPVAFDPRALQATV